MKNIKYIPFSKEKVSYTVNENFDCMGIANGGKVSKMHLTKGSVVDGFPGRYRITNNNKVVKEDTALILDDGKQCFVIPKKIVTQNQQYSHADGFKEDMQEIKEEIGQEIDKIESKGESIAKEIKSGDTKKLLGFTLKQILVIAVIGLVVTKIVKK